MTFCSIGCGSQKQLESQKQEYEKLVAQHMDSTARVTALEAEKQEMIQLLNEAVSMADQIRVSGSYHWLMRHVMNMADQIRVSGSYHWLMRHVMNMADQIRVSGSYHRLVRHVNMADQIRVSGPCHQLVRHVVNMTDQIRVSGSCHRLVRHVADQIRVSGSCHWSNQCQLSSVGTAVTTLVRWSKLIISLFCMFH